MSWRGANGLRPWLMQRLSAVYIASFLLFILLTLIGTHTVSFTAWHHWVSLPLVNAAFALFVVALLIHAWVGIRDVIMDYVQPVVARFLLLLLFGLIFLISLLWSLRVLFSVTMS